VKDKQVNKSVKLLIT